MMIAPSTKDSRRYFIVALLTLTGVTLTVIAISIAWETDRQKVIFLSGLLLNVLMAGYLVSQIRRTARIALLVEERTNDFQKSNEGLSHEIAERTKAEDALKQQLQFLQTLIDAIPAPIFYKDAEGRYLGCNEAYTSCLGQAREEIIGKTVYDMAPKDLADIYNTADNALLLSAGIQRYEYSVIYADGIRREVYFTQTTFKDLAGRVAGLVGVMIDISERKRAERDIRKLNAELALKVEQLIAVQEELIRKEKLATIGVLAGSVGNELRNPLGVMNNAVYYLNTVMNDADATVKEYMDIIKHEIDISQKIITDFLDAVRTLSPKATLVKVDDLVDKTLGKCAIPENISVNVDIPESLPCISADPAQMCRVLQNLINNAVQAMPAGGYLRISAREVRGARDEGRGNEEKDLGPRTSNLFLSYLVPDFIEISVADTGEGISAENMKRLFQPLFTTRARGIGLGLTVCKNLTEANGGSIEVESKPGEGTRISIMLPVGG